MRDVAEVLSLEAGRAVGRVHSRRWKLFLYRTEEVAQTTVERKRLNEEELKRAVKEALTSVSSHPAHNIQKAFRYLFGMVETFETNMSAKIMPTKDDDGEDLLKAAIAKSVKRGSILSKNYDSDGSNHHLPEDGQENRPLSLNSSGVHGHSYTPFDSPSAQHGCNECLVCPDPAELLFTLPLVLPDSTKKEGVEEEIHNDREASSQCPEITKNPLPIPGEEESLENAMGPLASASNSQPGSALQTRDLFNSALHHEANRHAQDTPNLKVATDINNFTSRRQSLESAQRTSVLGAVMDNIFHRRQIGALDDLFFLSRPGLYFDMVRLLPLALSLYIALWCVQYCALKTQGLYKFLSAMPAVLSIFCLIYTVKCAALLKAIYHIDKDAMLEVLEQTEGSRLLGETIREKLLSKLDLMGDPYSELRNLFRSIDFDHSNRLSRLEFEILMDKLDINFSKRKWKQIYHEIDRNYDDEVSFDEFFFFLFPNHDVSVAMERKRLKIIRRRVAAKTVVARQRTNQNRASTYATLSGKEVDAK
eukprot:scaffold1365_cov163-Ochromonas_danica.AAC.32